MTLSRDSSTPPYRLVADQIRRDIRAGRLGPDERAPSSRELETQHKIANMTARSALRLLREEGLIYSVPGRGNFVANPLPPESAPNEGGKLHSDEYRELSERLDQLTETVEEMTEALKKALAFTGQHPKP